MKITQIRSATIIIHYQNYKILVDPMLSRKGTKPRFLYLKKTNKNPQVELPEYFETIKMGITHSLITHCQKGHFDHLDSDGRSFLRDNKIKTFCTKHDNEYLINKKIDTITLPDTINPFFDGTIELVRARHTKGFLTPFMEHGVGYFLQLPDHKSLYIMGDTILTDEIRSFIKDKQPHYIVAPTGMAKLDFGSPLLLDEEEIIELANLSSGIIIANHMDALDHCRISREKLKNIISKNILNKKFLIPEDGDTLDLV